MKLSHAFRNTFLAASLFCCAFPLHADEASKRVKVGELLAILHLDQNLNQLLNQQSALIQRAVGSMSQGKFTPDQQKDAEAFMRKVNGIMRETMNWTKLKPQITDIYASTYTEQDLDGILAFYRSPVGQKMIQVQPELGAKSQGITQQHLQEMQPKLRDAFDQFRKEMQVKYPAQMPR
jgi:hypothetical protein